MNSKVILLSIAVVILAACGIYATYNANDSNQAISIDESSLEVEDNLLVNEDESLEKKLYSSDQPDTNAILVENSSLELKDSIVNKSGDSSDNGDNVDFYGSNSAILVKKGSVASLDNLEIVTNSTGSNAIFVTNGEASENNQQMPNSNNQNMPSDGKPPEIPSGSPNENQMDQADNNPMSHPGENQMNSPENMPNSENYSDGGANATISNVKIDTYKDKSRGLDATYGGVIKADNVIINTRGGSCAALATDRGEGTVIVKNSELNTGVDNGTGRGSPCIYSTGEINVSDSTGTAYASQIACIEGKNSITLNNCEFKCFGQGNREDNGEFVDLGGIFIYQSMSGDADVGTATFNVSDSSLSIDETSDYYNSAPLFHITNTNAIINLKSTELSFGSDILLDVSGQNQWGTVNENGGNLEFNVDDEELEGNIHIDEISSLKLNMENSKYTGTINPNDTFGQTDVIIDSSSTWTLTGDSHVSSIEINGNIDYGEFTLYVDGVAYTANNTYKA